MQLAIAKILSKFIAVEKQDVARMVIVTAVFFATLGLYNLEVFRRFEYVTYDYRCLLRGARPADSRIVVIEISDDSIAKIGRWPWERSWHAALIKILSDLGAKAVLFDVVFSEPSDPVKDAALAEAITKSGRVYLAKFVEISPSTKKLKLLTSLPEFTDNAKGGGHINLHPDEDGVMRRIPLLLQAEDRKVPQLSFSAVLDHYGVKLDDVRTKGRALEIPLKNGEVINVPLDSNKEFMINWVGRWKEAYFHFSYADLVKSYAIYKKGGQPEIPMNSFKGKFCYIGTTATGLFDIRPTPLEPSYPAVGVNLTVLNNLLERRFITPLSGAQNMGILALVALILLRIMQSKNYFKAALFSVLLAVSYMVVAAVLFILFDIWVNIIYALVLVLMTYFFVTLYNQLSVAIERAKLMRLATRDSLTGLYNIGHFKLLLQAELATVAMRREKKLSILMSDVDDFKKTNDTYGHVTGDTVLREVAEAFKTNCRALDVAARYGGEEFILMLPGADAEIAYKIGDKIRKVINEKVFQHEKGPFSTSISIGVTLVSPDDKEIELIVARADRALYEAKHTGKNKVVIASDSPKVAVSPPQTGQK